MACRALTLANRTACAMLGPGDDAREVAQEVVVRVLERRTQLRDATKFDAWVHRIAAREALAAQRKRRHRRAYEREFEETDAGSTGDAADLPELFGMAEVARAALDRLGDQERVAMVLHYTHDLTDRQIAQVMRCRRGTVNSLLSRARARLRAMPEMQALTATDRKDHA
jgi:RNA polymerase sigma-70 factor, ECF subfamily